MDHSVAITASDERQPCLVFSDVFNVAVPFIDRHLDEGRGAKVALRSGELTVTYGELAENVNRTGNALLALGIGRGERLLMIVGDYAEFFYLFWGAIKAGIVPVPVNTLLRAEDFRYLIENSECAGLVHSPEYAREVEPAVAQVGHAPAHVLPTDAPDSERSVRALIAVAAPELSPATAAPDDDCFWLYSSGSTGRPKGAVHAHRSMAVASQRYGVETLGLGEDDVCYSAAKLFFAYGLGNAMTFPLWVGGTAILEPGRPTPERTFAVMERHKPTLYFGVPTLYAAQLMALEAANPDLSSLRLCVSAGEALPGDLLRRWQERTGVIILDGIGSTELLHIFISNKPDDFKAGASGRVTPGYEARIVGEGGGEVGDDELGRLWIRGETAAKRYWNDPQRTARTMVDGWIDTGDTYSRDADGYYIYGGRSDDMLKVGGMWCSPFEIEARLVESDKVMEAAVVGRADDHGLVKPEAWIVLRDPDGVTDDLRAELRLHCKSALAPYKYPRWFQFVKELPKTATGKIQRFKLRQSGAS